MKPLFPQWSDSALRLSLLAVVGAGVAIVGGPLLYVRTPYHTGQGYEVDQPVQFDHRHHVRDDGIDCLYCHRTAERSWTAGIPATEVCAGCHSQVWNQSPMLEPVRRSYFSRMPIPWNRVHRLPKYVYFNHAIHINKGVGCVTCHGRVDEMAVVRQEAPLSMGWCLDCHRAPERNLRPLDQITSMTWKPSPSDDPQEGQRLAQAYHVERLTSCTTCHR